MQLVCTFWTALKCLVEDWGYKLEESVREVKYLEFCYINKYFIHPVFDTDISMLCLRDQILVSHSKSSTSLFKPCSAESVIYSLFPVSICHSLYPLCRFHCKREMNKPFFILRFHSLLFCWYIVIFPQLDVLPKLETTLY